MLVSLTVSFEIDIIHFGAATFYSLVINIYVFCFSLICLERRDCFWLLLLSKDINDEFISHLNFSLSYVSYIIFQLEELLMGHTDGLSERMSSEDHLLSDPESGSGLDDEDTTGCSEEILYSASFEELANSIVQYDTIIWLSISLLLVLAWGVGVIMLLYIPFRRYVLKKDISSRRLYLTPNEIVYKVYIV